MIVGGGGLVDMGFVRSISWLSAAAEGLHVKRQNPEPLRQAGFGVSVTDVGL